MLEELTAYKTFGSADHLAEMARVISSAPCTIGDLFVIADSNSTVEIPRIKATIALLCELELCTATDRQIEGNSKLRMILDSPQSNSIQIGLLLFQRMLDEGLIPLTKIQYDLDSGCGYLRQLDIPLRYSQMRNFLIDVGLFRVEENKLLFTQIGAKILESKMAEIETGMTLDELMEKLKQDQEAGAAAELFVMEFEKKRLGTPLADTIRQVSLVSVSAGYDIASYESVLSTQYDRFIEVKAIGSNGFYFSANELKIAKKIGKQYCLYLVDMRKKNRDGYKPEVIADPAKFFAESTDWRVTPDSYHITRVFQE